MKITVDANILFSALLRNGATRQLWFYSEIESYSQEYLLVEFEKYKPYLRNKFTGTTEEFESFLKKLVSQIRLVKGAELKPFLPAAMSLIADEKDWLYLACALKEDTIIWSNDKEFKKQRRIKVKTTAEMLEYAGFL